MRRYVLAAATVTALVAGSASAHGPSGSYEGSKDHRSKTNQVRCGKGTRAPRAYTVVYAGTNGAEVCSDRGPLPVQGRFIVSKSGYVAADGDNSNPGPARGYFRLDKSGPHCSVGRDQDSTHSRTAGKPQTCDGG